MDVDRIPTWTARLFGGGLALIAVAVIGLAFTGHIAFFGVLLLGCAFCATALMAAEHYGKGKS